MNEPINIVFDGPPSHESGRFVEVENDAGEGISVGQWIERPDGFWALRIEPPKVPWAEVATPAIREAIAQELTTYAESQDAETEYIAGWVEGIFAAARIVRGGTP